MYVAFFVILTLIAVLQMPLKFRLLGHINLVHENKGYYTVRFFKLPVNFGKLSILDSKLYITFKNGKRKRITDFIESKTEVSLVSYLDNAFFLVADIRELNFFIKIGAALDAGITAITSAFARILTGAFRGFLMQRYPKLKSLTSVEAEFEQDIIELSFSGMFYMSLAEIVYGIIYAARRASRFNRRFKNRGGLLNELNIRIR